MLGGVGGGVVYKARLLSLFTWHSMYRGSNEVITNVIAFKQFVKNTW